MKQRKVLAKEFLISTRISRISLENSTESRVILTCAFLDIYHVLLIRAVLKYLFN